MSYTIEKEENGGKAMVVSGWEKGVAKDPYSGHNRMNQVNLETEGEISVGYPITASATSGATLGVPIADSARFFGYGTPGVPTGTPQSFAILDATGQVFEATGITGTFAYLSTNHIETNASNLDGVCYWLGYLFKTRNTNIDYWTGSAWVQGWKTTLTGTTKHFMYVGTDNVLYITNGNYLASLTAATPTAFDPTNAATYAYSIVKLALPVNDVAISLAEVGSGSSGSSTLLIGGQFNAIYPWDKVSSSFGLPIYVADQYIQNMVSANQNAFIFPGKQGGSAAGGRGRIYVTNGSQATLFFKMPDYVFGEQDPYYGWGDAIFHRNNLIFSCSVIKNSTASVLFAAEVYAIDFDTKAFRAISDIPANATGKACANCLISTYNLSQIGFGYILAWDDFGSAPGIGYSGTTAGVGTAAFTTDLIPVGTFLQKTTNSQIEYKLRSPLQSGETISIVPVIDGTTGTALTFSPTVTTGAISGVAPVTFQGAQWLQFQVSMTGNSATSGVRLREIRIR